MEVLQPKLRFPEFEGDWKNELLDDISVRGSGHTPNKKFKNYYNGDIKWVSLADSKNLDNGYIEKTMYEISKDGLKNSSAVLHPKETVILSRDAGVGKSAVMKTDMAVSQHFMVWKPIESKLNNWFLYYKLQILKPEFERIAIGNTIKTIGLPYFKKLSFLIPLVKEQAKIANFLSSIDKKSNLLKEKRALLEQYKKGIIQKIFNQEIRFKDDKGNDFGVWKKDVLSSVFNISTGKSKSNFIENDGKYIIVDMGGISSNCKLIAKKQTNYNSDFLNIGDLIMPKDDIGDGQIIGKTIVINENNKYILGDHVYRLVLKELSYNAHFFSYYINSEIINIELRRKTNGTAQISLNKDAVYEQLIFIPDVEEQTKIANFLSAIDEKIALVTTQIEEAQEYKKGLLQQMFV